MEQGKIEKEVVMVYVIGFLKFLNP